MFPKGRLLGFCYRPWPKFFIVDISLNLAIQYSCLILGNLITVLDHID